MNLKKKKKKKKPEINLFHTVIEEYHVIWQYCLLDPQQKRFLM